MESKHTPGPWFAKKAYYGDGFVIVNAINGNRLTVRLDKPEGGFAEPDVHLIAAAPELLAALIAVRDFVDGKPGAVEPFGLVRAAIAAAEGRA